MGFNYRDKSLIVFLTTEYDGNPLIAAILTDPIHNEGKIINLHFIVMEMPLDLLAEAFHTYLDVHCFLFSLSKVFMASSYINVISIFCI